MNKLNYKVITIMDETELSGGYFIGDKDDIILNENKGASIKIYNNDKIVYSKETPFKVDIKRDSNECIITIHTEL